MQPQSGSFFLWIEKTSNGQRSRKTDQQVVSYLKWVKLFKSVEILFFFFHSLEYPSDMVNSSCWIFFFLSSFLFILLHPPISYATRRCLSDRRPSSRLRRYKLCFPSKCDFNKKCTRYNVTLNALTFLQWTPTHHLIKC